MELAREPGHAVESALPQVQSVVAARLALLSGDARAVAEVAAAVGRDFRFDILAQASDLEEDALVRALDELAPTLGPRPDGRAMTSSRPDPRSGLRRDRGRHVVA